MGKKLNPDAKPAEKLLNLYSLLLFSRNEWSLSDLAGELCCSKQTVSRLIEQLEASNYGKVIREQRGREAVYSLDRPKRPQVTLDAESLEMLVLCHDFVRHLLPETSQKNLDGTLRLARAYADEGDENSQPLTAKTVYKGRIDYSGKQDILRAITRAIKNRKVCSLEYKRSPLESARHHNFAPLRLLAYHETLRVQGWLVTEDSPARPLYDDPVTLPLQRIESLELTARSAAKVPPLPETPAAFGLMTDDIFSAQILFTGEAAVYVAERQWSPRQSLTWNDDKSLLLELESQSRLELLSWILSFGDSAEVISPDALRRDLIELVKNMGTLYDL